MRATLNLDAISKCSGELGPIFCPICGVDEDDKPLRPSTIWTADAPDPQDELGPSTAQVLEMYYCSTCCLTFSLHIDTL